MSREDVHIHLHLDALTINVVHGADESLKTLINSIKLEIKQMADSLQAALDELTQDVAELTSVDQSAVALIQGFSARLDAAVAAAQAAGATPAQLASFTDLNAQVKQRTTELASAVSAGTSAAP